jgi:hypothetical protein
MRMIEEEAKTLRKTSRDAKTVAENGVCWRCFLEALRSEVELRS